MLSNRPKLYVQKQTGYGNGNPIYKKASTGDSGRRYDDIVFRVSTLGIIIYNKRYRGIVLFIPAGETVPAYSS